MLCFSLESRRRGDSNEHKQHTIIKKNYLNYSKYTNVRSYGIFSLGFKKDFKTAVAGKRAISVRATKILA